ncbi:MAG: glycosyltransferase family 39 protein [Clostridiales bacterium]|nr:glycosyltransferase family 39 protein [Clostridiales bacterium]
MFSDYPPVYMYVLYLIGAIRAGVQAVFGVEWEIVTNPVYRFITFLPAILCDLGIGFVIYKIAKEKKDSEWFALFCSAAWLFNPAIFLISGVWGQVESVYVLMLLVSLVFVRKQKLLPAYILFGIAILTKPQSLFIAPVYLYSAYEFLQEKKFDVKSAIYPAYSIGAGMLAMIIVSLPFGLTATMNQLWSGVRMYDYATVNAFNFWTLAAGNWGALDSQFMGISVSTWGVIIVLTIIICSLYALHINKTRHGGKHFYLIVAALFIVIFAFSVKMHERYLFPGILFLLIYYVENRERKEFILYWSVSAVFFVNCIEVLRWANSGYDWDALAKSSILVVPYVMVFLAVTVIIVLVRNLIATKSYTLSKEEDSLKYPPPMRKLDYAFIGILIAAYSIIAFVNLGDFRSPQTTWVDAGNAIEIDFGRATRVSQFVYFNEARHDVSFELYSSDGQGWEHVRSFTSGDVFAWHFTDLNISARYIKIEPHRGLRLQEAAFLDSSGEVIPIVTTNAENLTDEQHLVPERRYFMNSTYFDEIYHPRTAYEFAHGLYPYETTHPPLGKVIIAGFVKIFGMAPFVWRLPGTLFGIFMIPLIYAFARRLLKSNNYALFAAFIFAFDFMLFSHTRLATIDTFVTFFVIAMYFLMYCYINGIEKNSFGRSLGLLTLCGVAMGLAIASKWQGVYGAIGLPILFFPALYKLYFRNKSQAIYTFFACFGIFIAIPLVIYALSYVPFANSVDSGEGLLTIIRNNQESMFSYHSELVAEHSFASHWWSWPLIIMPLWQYQTIISDTMRQGMSSLGSPAVWWLGIFVTGFAIYSLAKKRRNEYDTVFLLIAYAANFLPWVFVTRLTFIYHYFPSVPFVVLLIALFFKQYIKRDYICFVYVAVVLALFIMFYPVISGMPVSTEYIEKLRWLPGWIFA